MRRFRLERDDVDHDGVTTSRSVAEGIEFSDRVTVVHWIAHEHRATIVWPTGVRGVEEAFDSAIPTRIAWID